ncbi:MAG: hypothetical protein HYY03_08855, partial [Chloroflexi bacterium]|nr:hypothetical protein [Chloroflexota bacterium]
MTAVAGILLIASALIAGLLSPVPAHATVVATTESADCVEDQNCAIPLEGADDQNPASAITATISSLPALGTLTQFDGTPITEANTPVTDLSRRVVYRAAPDGFGSPYTTFQYYVTSEAGGDSAVQTVTVNVTGVPDQPVATGPNPLFIVEDTPLDITLTGYDPDGDPFFARVLDPGTEHPIGLLYQVNEDGTTGDQISVSKLTQPFLDALAAAGINPANHFLGAAGSSACVANRCVVLNTQYLVRLILYPNAFYDPFYPLNYQYHLFDRDGFAGPSRTINVIGVGVNDPPVATSFDIQFPPRTTRVFNLPYTDVDFGDFDSTESMTGRIVQFPVGAQLFRDSARTDPITPANPAVNSDGVTGSAFVYTEGAGAYSIGFQVTDAGGLSSQATATAFAVPGFRPELLAPVHGTLSVADPPAVPILDPLVLTMPVRTGPHTPGDLTDPNT